MTIIKGLVRNHSVNNRENTIFLALLSANYGVMGSFWLLADATEIHWQEPLLDRCNKEGSVKKVRKLTGQKDLKHIIYYEGNDMRRNAIILQIRNIFWSFVLFAKYF